MRLFLIMYLMPFIFVYSKAGENNNLQTYFSKDYRFISNHNLEKHFLDDDKITNNLEKRQIKRGIPKKSEKTNLAYIEGKFTNDVIDMTTLGVMSGVIWVGLNFFRILITDFLFTKKLIIEQKKKYLSNRKSGYLTAFILGLGVYLISNSGSIIYKYFQNYNFVYTINILIALQLIWILYKIYSFNNNLRKEITSTLIKGNTDSTCHLDNIEAVKEDNDYNTLDNTKKLEKMYKKIIPSSEGKNEK